MFNSPLLDVTIGLVLIFLLYSLLVTSIQEVIASLFAFRARMLKNAIIKGMLSNTPDDPKIKSLWKGFCNYICNIALKFIEFFKGKDKSKINKTIGLSLYNHPIIKNYGSSRFFAIPSYITKSNFSKIIVELLKNEALTKATPTNQNSADIVKIGDVLSHYKLNDNQLDCFLDKEPAQILYSFWEESNYNIDTFRQKLESWFDDMMNRVSGWYKRRTQFRLFFIGLVIAVSFNVNSIKIANRLSVDKDAREKMVQLAIATADKYKDDPRVKKIITKDDKVIIDTTEKDSALRKDVFNEYKNQLDSAKKLLNGDIARANQILSIGWGIDTLDKPYVYEKNLKSSTLKDTLLHTYQYLVNYSKNKKKAAIIIDTTIFISSLQKWAATGLTHAQSKDSLFKAIRQFTSQPKQLPAYSDDSVKMAQFLHKLVRDSICKLSVKVTGVMEIKNRNSKKNIQLAGYRHYTLFESIWYVLKNICKGSNFFGFLITAFAISLGAPFWFDLLNKLIKIRASGKKEDGTVTGTEQTAPAVATTVPPTQPPTTINVSTQQKPDEEAVG